MDYDPRHLFRLVTPNTKRIESEDIKRLLNLNGKVIEIARIEGVFRESMDFEEFYKEVICEKGK